MTLKDSMSLYRSLAFVGLGALSALGSCGGPSATGPSTISAGAPSSSTSAAPITSPADAGRFTWAAIGCFVGGPWSEALGATAADRAAATNKRCRYVVTDALYGRADDEKALEAMSAIDPAAVDRVSEAVKNSAPGASSEPLVTLLRASAEAAREAMVARALADSLRASLAAKDQKKHDDDLKTKAHELGGRTALAKLMKGDFGAHWGAARVVALVLAADHLEAARGLEPRAKILAAAPAFDIVFGVPNVAGGADAKPGDWLAYLTAAATTAGHAPKSSAGAGSHERELMAFSGVAAGFADKLEAIAPKLEAGDAKDAATGYAKRLRAELEASEQKAKAKADAKTTADQGDKKPKN